MYLEIPKFEKCCCCVPLRIGIITLGYLSLGLDLLAIGLDMIYNENLDLSTHMFVLYRGASFFAQRWLFLAVYCVEIAFIVVLLIGAHTRNSRLMLVYYYYGVTTVLASVAIFVFVNLRDVHNNVALYLADFTVIFCGIVTQAYLLLLIRSELEKPRESLCFVNHLSEIYVQQPVTNCRNPL